MDYDDRERLPDENTVEIELPDLIIKVRSRTDPKVEYEVACSRATGRVIYCPCPARKTCWHVEEALRQLKVRQAVFGEGQADE